MICVTGAETHLDELSARVTESTGDLHEIRADFLETIDDGLFALVEREGPRLLFCCRAAREGGSFVGTENDRLALLERAQRAGARYIDVEHDVPIERFERTGMVLSWHDFEGAGDVVATARSMAERQPGVLKLAQRIDDAARVAHLLEARSAVSGPAVFIGMGAAGLVSRLRYRALGSAWTYAAADRLRSTAPGQLTVEQMRALGLPEAGDAPFLALVGGPNVLASPGPRVYSAIFRARGLPFSYLPVVTASLRECLPVLEALGVCGLSVTMPLKHEALELSTPNALAARLGSVNSMRRDSSGWQGINTDVEGVRAPLASLPLSGTALVLGAGGAAAAAAHACVELGLRVRVSARSARGLFDVIPWERRGEIDADVLVNATPVAGDDSPWPEDVALPRCVFDLAIAKKSRLVERARAEGCTVLDATTMWIHQGAQQLSWMLDLPFLPHELEAQL